MKSLLLIITLVLCATASVAQDRPSVEEINERPGITKGYYSIGDHARKLPAVNHLLFFKTSVAKEQPQKGYYAIDGKPQTELIYQLPKSGDRPKKGYYSISGTNQ